MTQVWEFEHPLSQFKELRYDVLRKIEAGYLSVDRLREMDAKEIGKSR